MKVARFAVLGIALVAGLLAAVLAMNLVQPPEAVEQVVEAPVIESDEVLVAKMDIPLGSRVNEESLGWQVWPREAINEHFISRSSQPDAIEQLQGTVARTTFLTGEPVNEQKLIQSDRGYLSAILPQGKRAIATKISARTTAGGFILPNDRVDLILTRRQDNSSSDDQYISETILTNVRVLAIDQQIEEKDGEKVVVGETATLELTPAQTELVTLAEQMAIANDTGGLSLALRSLEDSEVSAEEEAAARLRNGSGGGITVVKFGVRTQVPVL